MIARRLPLSDWLSWVFFASSLIFLVQAVAGGSEGGLAYLSAILSLFLFVSLKLSSDRAVSVVTIVSLAVLAFYTLRVHVLLLLPERFSFPPNSLLSSHGSAAGIFILLCTAAFFLPLVLFMGGPAASDAGRPNRVEPVSFFTHWRLVAVFGWLTGVVHLILTVGYETGIAAVPTGPYAFLLRLFPRTALLGALLLLLVKYGHRMSPMQRLAIQSPILLLIITDLLGRHRNALVAPALIWLVAYLAVHRDPPLKVGHLVAIVAAVVTTVAVLFTFLTTLRLPTETSVPSAPSQLVHSGLERLSDRLNGFDKTVIVMGSPRERVPISASQVLRTMALSFVPGDAADGSRELSLAKLFGTEYERVPASHTHASGWSGFGIVFRIFGWWGPVVYAVAALALAGMLRALERQTDVNTFLRIMLLYGSFFIFAAGAFDMLIPALVSETILLLAPVFIFGKALPAAVRPTFVPPRSWPARNPSG